MKNALLGRLLRIANEDAGAIRPRLHAMNVASRLLPLQVGNQLRASLLRQIGFEVGDGTQVSGTPNIAGGGQGFVANLSIGRDCVIEVGCSFDLGAKITIGDRVTIGHQVLILTSTHELGPREHRAGPIVLSPVTIHDGAWLGPRSTILPGVTVGEGAIVLAGAVVNKDVEPHTKVGGSPARQLEALTP